MALPSTVAGRSVTLPRDFRKAEDQAHGKAAADRCKQDAHRIRPDALAEGPPETKWLAQGLQRPQEERGDEGAQREP
jgi:hypothetical protein